MRTPSHGLVFTALLAALFSKGCQTAEVGAVKGVSGAISCGLALTEVDAFLEERDHARAEDSLEWATRVCGSANSRVEAARTRVEAMNAWCRDWRHHLRQLILEGRFIEAPAALEGVRKACPASLAAEDEALLKEHVVDFRSLPAAR